MKSLERSKYDIFVFLREMIKMIPFHAVYLMVTAVWNAFLPTVQALAIAEFVNRVEGAYGGVLEVHMVLIPLIILLGIVIFKQMIPSVTNLIHVSAQNHLKIVLRNQFMIMSCKRMQQRLKGDINICQRFCQTGATQKRGQYLVILNI